MEAARVAAFAKASAPKSPPYRKFKKLTGISASGSPGRNSLAGEVNRPTARRSAVRNPDTTDISASDLPIVARSAQLFNQQLGKAFTRRIAHDFDFGFG